MLEAGLAELKLAALADSDAAALLDVCAPGLLPPLRERVLRDAAGNPLALVELPIALRSTGVQEASVPDSLPLTTRLEQAFAARVSTLPADTRSLLLVAAAEEGAALTDLLRAASELGGREVTLDALAPAVSAALVRIDGIRLRFRHPLMRSAIHETRSASERIAVHAALATIAGDPDRRAWHRAAAAVGSDEKVAAELEEAAERAQRRGATAIAMVALERAAQLADTPAHRGGRLVRAVEFAFELGRHTDVLRLLREAEGLELEALDRTRLAWLREVFAGGSWSGTARIAAFVQIAERMRLDGGADRALEALSMIALRCWWSNPAEEARRLMISAAERIDVSETDPRRLSILALAGPEERGAVVVDRVSGVTVDAGLDAEPTYLLGQAAMAVGAFAAAERILEVAVAALRAQGRLGLLAQALLHQAWTAVYRSRWRLASLAAAESDRLAQETGLGLWAITARLAEAAVAAYEGRADVAEALAANAEKVLLPLGANPMLALVQLPRGVVALGHGRHVEAYEHLRRIFDPADVAYHPHVRSWALIDLVEAAAHSGNDGDARQIVRELEALHAGTRSPILRAALDYARPVLTADEGAEDEYRRSIAELAGWPFARARLELAYGAWLRRRRRVADSRAPLREARDAFDALGAGSWSERARQELRASGETSRSRTLETEEQLSPQELQIAQMAAEGMTNKEIGRQLYLSHRTVGSHLYRTFPKLGITARSQLRAAMARRSGRP